MCGLRSSHPKRGARGRLAYPPCSLSPGHLERGGQENPLPVLHVACLSYGYASGPGEDLSVLHVVYHLVISRRETSVCLLPVSVSILPTPIMPTPVSPTNNQVVPFCLLN